MMSVCQIKDFFELVGKSCLAESFSNEHPECALRGMKRDDLPSYDHSAILAPVHENPWNSGFGAAEIPPLVWRPFVGFTPVPAQRDHPFPWC